MKIKLFCFVFFVGSICSLLGKNGKIKLSNAKVIKKRLLVAGYDPDVVCQLALHNFLAGKKLSVLDIYYEIKSVLLHAKKIEDNSLCGGFDLLVRGQSLSLLGAITGKARTVRLVRKVLSKCDILL